MRNYLDERADMYARLRMESESPSRMARMEKLFELSRHDPFVAVHFAQWRKGLYDSFEHMLIDLACTQSSQNKSLVDTITRFKQLEPTVILCQVEDIEKAQQIIKDRKDQS